MITYEFRCPKGHISEVCLPIDNSTRVVKCSVCNELAEKIISFNGNRPLGLPTHVHHKYGASRVPLDPIDLGDLDK